MNYGQFNDSDFISTKYIDWDRMYAIVTHVIIDVVDTCIAYDIESSFDGSQHVINLSQVVS